MPTSPALKTTTHQQRALRNSAGSHHRNAAGEADKTSPGRIPSGLQTGKRREHNRECGPGAETLTPARAPYTTALHNRHCGTLRKDGQAHLETRSRRHAATANPPLVTPKHAPATLPRQRPSQAARPGTTEPREAREGALPPSAGKRLIRPQITGSGSSLLDKENV